MRPQEPGSELMKRRRHLPHWQLGGSTYFVTFHSVRGELPPAARQQVVANALYDHGRRYELFFGVVMPDHVHLLLKPLEKHPGTCHSLSEITRSLKGVSARMINKLLKASGSVWQEESFDRIMRDEREYREKLEYMWNNPLKKGLVPDGQEYTFYIYPPDAQA